MDSVDGLLKRLEQLNDIGASLSKEHDIKRLLERILLAAKSITNADGGTLYRMMEDGQTLCFEMLRTDSLQIAMGGTSGSVIGFPNLPLRDATGAPNDSMVAAYAAIHQQTVNIANAYTESSFDFSGTRYFDERTGYRSQSLLAVPMKDHEGEIIGVLQLINAREPDSETVVPFSVADQHLTESLASQAAIALSNRLLLTQLEELFESFIKLINLAVDEKSHYTVGHCQRVTALTLLLADAVVETDEGPLASFTMNERERYELKIAALLHDCGKVTTPVHVVDKATKLHTLFDRWHLIDTRFEVLRRDAELLALRRQLTLRPCVDAQAEAATLATLQSEIESLEADRDFLRAVNTSVGSNQEDALQRVRDIGKQRSWRNAKGFETEFLTSDEIENLTIKTGTLTAAERTAVNHHVVATIKMLEQLPWPKHLKNVPEYAAGHHERIDGKGYPSGLTGEQMSIQARVMGIADIFEALTATDRPYRSGMKLSQAISTMNDLKDNGHIDPELHEIFLRKRIYERYAEQFLDPLQIDILTS